MSAESGYPVPDPLLTQNGIGAGRSEQEQWKIRRANGGKRGKSDPKRLRFVREAAYGPESRGKIPYGVPKLLEIV